ncbi:hemicentin-2-like [Saccostrea cucullata]|uniref:hemicentin-2-like n=1 Tax=Saccostrea cuccullata TaxID=36930 RepID=UPI002ED0E2F5
MAYQILSKYQQNFTRLGIVCVDEIKAVFKDSFESQIKPVDLYNAINSCPQLNTGKDKLNLFQLKICYISPPQVPDYDMFDVSLLYKLIRNLCPNLTPTKGWGKTPDSNHLRIGDDIERFRDIRNKMFAHLKSSEVPDNIFVQFWKELQGSFHRAQKFITSFGYSVNYKENLKYIEKLDLGCEDLKRYKFQMEFLMMLRNQSQNTDVPKIKVNGNTKVNCGDDARFQALTEHCPSNHNWPITWEIEKGSEIKVIDIKKEKYRGSSSTELVIRKVVKEDAGEYRAVISRELDGEHFKILSNILKLDALGDLPKLEISQATSAKNCVIIHYSCCVQNTSNCLNSIQWTRNGDLLMIKTAKYNGGGLTDKYLKIFSPTEEDSGQYRCKLSNAVGSDEKCIVLDLPSVFTNHDTDFSEHRVTLICKVLVTEGSPDVEKVVWTKEKKQIDILGSGGKYTGGNETYPSLVIHGVNSNDAGEYQCRVSNAVGDTYSNPIHLGLPHIEKDITCSEEDGENLLTCKITVKSIPEAKAAEWRVQQAPEDVFQAINIHESTFRGSTVSLPHPILNVHGFNPELQRLIQFTATNFIGEKTTVIQSEKYPKEDAVMKETDSHISKYANGSAAVLFANLRYDLIELFPQDKIENIKCLLHELNYVDELIQGLYNSEILI